MNTNLTIEKNSLCPLDCALLVVDVQNDFLPNGSLEVPHSESVLPQINSLIPNYSTVVITQDWHPINHISFAKRHGRKIGDTIVLKDGSSQRLWPEHCIQNTYGAELSAKLTLPNDYIVIKKGQDQDIDSYSAFFDNQKRKTTSLHDTLIKKNIYSLDICGIATDVCVAATAFDAVKLGYKTRVLTRACVAVDKDNNEHLYKKFASENILINV